LPDKTNYRKFKLRIPGNDDFAHMNEAISRRLSEKNRKDWGLPQLFLIDGGKGQLGAALKVRSELGQQVPMIGLAKREEEIVIKKGIQEYDEEYLRKIGGFVSQESDDFTLLLLPKNSDIVKLLQRIRDESHRFAVSYHSSLKRTRQTKSQLDEIPSVGPETRKKLLRKFGSLKALNEASVDELAVVVGKNKAETIKQYLS